MPNEPPGRAFGRLLLKVTGEALSHGGAGNGIDPDRLGRLVEEVRGALEAGGRLAIVTGGGNLVRGAPLARAGMIDRAEADVMGMLGTVINALAIAAALRHGGIAAEAVSAVGFHRYVPVHEPRRAREMFDSGTVVVFGGGVGNPFFSTDTTAALRAVELGCDAVLKATKVDGVYTADPAKDPGARRYARLNYGDAMRDRLGVMDATAFAMCQEHDLPIVVFDYHAAGNIARVVRGEPVGTVVDSGATALG
ncbi:MAG: UMP kinase [Phycisphaerales bacterium]